MDRGKVFFVVFFFIESLENFLYFRRKIKCAFRALDELPVVAKI